MPIYVGVWITGNCRIVEEVRETEGAAACLHPPNFIAQNFPNQFTYSFHWMRIKKLVYKIGRVAWRKVLRCIVDERKQMEWRQKHDKIGGIIDMSRLALARQTRCARIESRSQAVQRTRNVTFSTSTYQLYFSTFLFTTSFAASRARSPSALLRSHGLSFV